MSNTINTPEVKGVVSTTSLLMLRSSPNFRSLGAMVKCPAVWWYIRLGVVPLPGYQSKVKVKLGILTKHASLSLGEGYTYTLLIQQCFYNLFTSIFIQKFGSSKLHFFRFLGFSNTPRPPHGRDNCSFSSWWHVGRFCLTERQAQTTRFLTCVWGFPHLWNT